MQDRITTLSTFSSWKNGLVGDGKPVTTLKAVSGTPTPTQLSTLAEKEGDVLATLSCLQEKLHELRTQSTAISTTQESIQSLKSQIADEKQTIEVARDRVKYIRHPEEHTSYYESWFPLNRPLKQSSLTILMSLSLVLSLTLLFSFLSFLGFSPTVQVDYKGLTLLSSIRQQLTGTFWIVLLLLVGTLWYFIYRGARKA